MVLVTYLIMERDQEHKGSYRTPHTPPSKTDSGLAVMGQRTSDMAAPLDEGSLASPLQGRRALSCVSKQQIRFSCPRELHSQASAFQLGRV